MYKIVITYCDVLCSKVTSDDLMVVLKAIKNLTPEQNYVWIRYNGTGERFDVNGVGSYHQ